MDRYLARCPNALSNTVQLSPSTSIRKYNKSWEEHHLLKDWIKKGINNSVAFCKVCNCDLKVLGGIGDLKTHALTAKHIERSKAIEVHKGSDSPFIETSKYNQKVSNIELHLAAFCAEHNISFLAMDHLVPLLQQTIIDSELIKKTTCARTKTTSLVQNVLGKTHHDDLCEILSTKKFSLCVDESTDISSKKLLSLVVRVENKGKICDFFFNIIKVVDCNAKGIYELIVNDFSKNNIKYKENLIGFAADGANVMTGANHSVARLLKNDCPNLIIFKCTCHSFALCANNACKFLPPYIENGAREIYNFIQNSPKRVEIFADLQILLDYKPRKMLHPSQTRWLSLEATVNQLLSRIGVLKLFFLHEDFEKLDSADRILSYLQKPEFELYLQFLSFVLNDINKLNRIFQSESPQIHSLYNETSRLYLKIFEYIVKDEYICIEKFNNIDLNNCIYLKDLMDIYLGAKVNIALNSTHKLSLEDEMIFRNYCLKFYVELCNSLLKKFDFDNHFLKCVEFLAPSNVIKNNNRSISQLAKFFPDVVDSNNIQQIDDEWRELRHFQFKENNLSNETNIETFWEIVLNTNRCDGSEAYPFLKKLVYAVLSIPISTANVERIFSQINVNKNKIRNKLDIPTLSGILITTRFSQKI